MIEIAGEGSLEERVAGTVEAMAAEAEFIYQGVLLEGRMARLGGFSLSRSD